MMKKETGGAIAVHNSCSGWNTGSPRSQKKRTPAQPKDNCIGRFSSL